MSGDAWPGGLAAFRVVELPFDGGCRWRLHWAESGKYRGAGNSTPGHCIPVCQIG